MAVTQWYGETFKVFPVKRLSATLKSNDNCFCNIWQSPSLIIFLVILWTYCRKGAYALFSQLCQTPFSNFLIFLCIIILLSPLTTCVYMNNPCMLTHLYNLVLESGNVCAVCCLFVKKKRKNRRLTGFMYFLGVAFWSSIQLQPVVWQGACGVAG